MIISFQMDGKANKTKKTYISNYEYNEENASFK